MLKYVKRYDEEMISHLLIVFALNDIRNMYAIRYDMRHTVENILMTV